MIRKLFKKKKSLLEYRNEYAYITDLIYFKNTMCIDRVFYSFVVLITVFNFFLYIYIDIINIYRYLSNFWFEKYLF